MPVRSLYSNFYKNVEKLILKRKENKKLTVLSLGFRKDGFRDNQTNMPLPWFVCFFSP